MFVTEEMHGQTDGMQHLMQYLGRVALLSRIWTSLEWSQLMQYQAGRWMKLLVILQQLQVDLESVAELFQWMIFTQTR